MLSLFQLRDSINVTDFLLGENYAQLEIKYERKKPMHLYVVKEKFLSFKEICVDSSKDSLSFSGCEKSRSNKCI